MPKNSNEYKDRMTVLNDCSEDKKKANKSVFLFTDMKSQRFI